MWTLSADETRRLGGSSDRACSTYSRFRSIQGRFGVSQESVQSSTIFATASPNRVPDLLQPRPAAVVLRGVVQQRADRFVFAAAIVQDDGGDAHEMADVGGLVAFAHLLAMHIVRDTSRRRRTAQDAGLAMPVILVRPG